MSFFEKFESLEQEKVILAELEVEHGPSEWRKGHEAHKFHLGYIEAKKIALADLTYVPPIALNKSLLADLSKMADNLKADHLYLALSNRNVKQLASVLRSLIVYGFEKVKNEEVKLFTAKADKLFLRMEISREEDFVDL